MPPRKPTPGTLHDLGVHQVPSLLARRVRVYVPSGRDPRLVRPTLYLFDGQNVLDDHGSYAGGWYAHSAVDRLTLGETTIAPFIVAIDHGGTERIDELGPFRMGDKGGKTDALLDWMVGTLMPSLHARFPTMRKGAVGAVVGGSSMGGLAALYAHLARPEAFGGALCLSPSFWFGGGEILRWAERRPHPSISRVYLDCGTREGGGRMVVLVERMAALLGARGYGPKQLMWRPDRRGAHAETHWRRRLPKALRFMFHV
jgi:predicted alpha/beta superfamily hydrolase